MKTIGITKETRQMIREFSDDGESVNDTVTRLLKDAEVRDNSELSKRTNIKITEDNLEKLKGLKSYPSEPVSNVVQRLLYEKLKH